MTRWREFRLWYGATRSLERVYEFKRDTLLPLLEGSGVGYAFILDESDFVLARMDIDEPEKRIQSELGPILSKDQPFSRVTVENWSPEEDARNRIQSALARLRASGWVPTEAFGPGWGVTGRDARGTWQIVGEDIEEKTSDFARFMSQVAGDFTRSYLRAMPRRITDRWLKSLFIHLLLDSISTPQNEEEEIRSFPYI